VYRLLFFVSFLSLFTRHWSDSYEYSKLEETRLGLFHPGMRFVFAFSACMRLMYNYYAALHTAPHLCTAAYSLVYSYNISLQNH
jgi:hypothetical protein